VEANEVIQPSQFNAAADAGVDATSTTYAAADHTNYGKLMLRSDL